MSTWVIIGAIVALVLLSLVRRPGLDRSVATAIRADDPAPVLASVGKLPHRQQPDAWHHAIQHVWRSYHRELALAMIRQLAVDHPDARITQWWLKHVQEVEPGLSQQTLGAQFLARYYVPEVAATCGAVG